MGKGGGGGGRGGGISGGSKSRLRLFRGFFGIGRLSPDSNEALKRIAIARGLHNVDELLVILGKKEYEVSEKEAFALLEKECGIDAVIDAAATLQYRAGKGYRPCNQLLDRYMKGMQQSEESSTATNSRIRLKKYCGYTDDELDKLK